MAFWLLSALKFALERVVYSVVTSLLCLCLAIAVGHYCGWIERWVWFVLEKEASKVVNGAHVTLGSFRLDWSAILQGKITLHASNAVLHTPQRQIWGWESPVIGRIGKATVEVNAPITIVHEIFLRTKLPIEVYSVFISDVQVFVERHDQVVNVYLCDPAAVLPPPPFLNPLSPRGADEALQDAVDFNRSDPLIAMRKDSEDDEEDGGDNNSDGNTPQQEKHKEQAQKLVNEMLYAVQNLGRAARKGALHTAVKQQGLEIAERLRDGLSTRNRNTSNLEQGVALIEQVGKVAVESLQAPKLILPERKKGRGGPEPPMARVGRIVMKDIRIFTKDSWIQLSIDEKNHNAKIKEHTGAFGGNSGKEDLGLTATKRGNWNRPIYIQSLVVRASELCPPMSLKDENNPEFPAVYQPIDKIVEVLWRRLLAEMAKSNAGRLFSTALGEVLSFIKSNPQSTTPNNSNPSTSLTSATTYTTNTTVSSSTPKSTKSGGVTSSIKKVEERSSVVSTTSTGTALKQTPPIAPKTSTTPSQHAAIATTTMQSMETQEVRV